MYINRFSYQTWGGFRPAIFDFSESNGHMKVHIYIAAQTHIIRIYTYVYAYYAYAIYIYIYVYVCIYIYII